METAFVPNTSFGSGLLIGLGAAMIVTFVGYNLAWRHEAPLSERRFRLPASTVLDAKLIGGSALFGIGWGIAGFCPGAAIPALGSGRWEVALFLVAVVAGFYLRHLLTKTAARAVA